MTDWFEYSVRVYPHHTDYAGITWHGSYIAWLEEARIACLRSHHIEYADLVAIGYHLPVVKLTIQYHRLMRMGEVAIVKARMQPLQGVRIIWDYEIYTDQNGVANTDKNADVNVSAQVTLVALDRDGKVMRHLPAQLKETLGKMIGA